MERLAAINLIHVFDIYLIIGFVVGTVLRLNQYRVVLALIFAAPKRWPKLIELLKVKRTVFLAWPTMLPIALTFLLMAVHTLAIRFIWDEAQIAATDLTQQWPALVAVLVIGVPMLYYDYRATFLIDEFDHAAVERELDRAEYWLRSWVAPAVRIVTFGYVNPRQMVSDEVHKALTGASVVLNQQMWEWALQIALRIAFGLTLWITWWIVASV